MNITAATSARPRLQTALFIVTISRPRMTASTNESLEVGEGNDAPSHERARANAGELETTRLRSSAPVPPERGAQP